MSHTFLTCVDGAKFYFAYSTLFRFGFLHLGSTGSHLEYSILTILTSRNEVEGLPKKNLKRDLDPMFFILAR